MNTKIKNTIREDTEWTEWKKCTPAQAKKKEKEGCQTKEETVNGLKDWYYRCPKNSTPDPNKIEDKKKIPDWAKDKYNCLLQSSAAIEGSGDVVIGHRNRGTPDYTRVTFKQDGSLTIEFVTGTKYTGYWECYGGYLKYGTCEDNEVFYYGERDKGWHKDKDGWLKSKGCPDKVTTPVVTTPVVTDPGTSNNVNVPNNDGKKDCPDKEGKFTKGCKGSLIRVLQNCLNNNYRTKLPKINENETWDDDTQDKLVELFPQYRKGVTMEEISIICNSKKPTEVDTTPSRKKPVKITFESKNKRKNVVNEDENLTQSSSNETSQSLQYEGNRENIDPKGFFEAMNRFGCIQDWMHNPRVAKVTMADNSQQPALYVECLVPKCPSNTEYVYYTNFTAQNLTTGKIQNNWGQFCPKMVEWVNRGAQGAFEPLFKKFNIDPRDTENLDEQLNTITSYLQEYVNKGAVSMDIFNWYNLVQKYESKYPGIAKIELFKDEEGNVKGLKPPKNSDVLTMEYTQVPMEELNTAYGWKDVKIYIPKGEIYTTQGTESGMSKKACVKELKTYLSYAIFNAARKGQSQLIPDFEVRYQNILNCSNEGQYSDVVFTIDDVIKKENQTVPSPFNFAGSGISKYGKDFEFRDIVTYLKGSNEVTNDNYNGEVLPSQNSYVISLSNPKVEKKKEPVQDSVMKSKIKSLLGEMVLDKRKVIAQEQIIKNRVNVLFENRIFESRKQRREFVVSILSEALFLESQGYDKKLINENFWDVVKVFFGEKGSESVFKSFKTRMGEWLTSHLSPKKSDGWIGDCIRKTISNIDIMDIENITNCKFLTRKITKSVIDKLDEKINNDELKDEGLYDIVRGGMADNVKSARFKDHIEDRVSSMICPILYEMSNNFDKTFIDMKKRLLDI